jgi:hypothetical protein
MAATVIHLRGEAVDDALELLDLLMVNHLLGPVKRAADRANLKRYPKLSRDSAKLAATVQVLLEATEVGADTTLTQVWEQIEARVPRYQLQASVTAVSEIVPASDADLDATSAPD